MSSAATDSRVMQQGDGPVGAAADALCTIRAPCNQLHDRYSHLSVKEGGGDEPGEDGERGAAAVDALDSAALCVRSKLATAKSMSGAASRHGKRARTCE